MRCPVRLAKAPFSTTARWRWGHGISDSRALLRDERRENGAAWPNNCLAMERSLAGALSRYTHKHSRRLANSRQTTLFNQQLGRASRRERRDTAERISGGT